MPFRIPKSGLVAMLLVFPLVLSGCFSTPQPKSDRSWITADVDHSSPVTKLAFDLKDGVQFSVEYLDATSGQARICFLTQGRKTCRIGLMPSVATLRPVAITDEAPDVMMIGFLLPGGEHMDIWLFGDDIAMSDNERICLIRGLPMSNLSCL